MTKTKFYEFINFLQKDHKVFGPVLDHQRLLVKEIKDVKKINLDGKLTYYSFKNLFLPACEGIFNYKNNDLIEKKLNYQKQVVLGMTLFDLKALELFDQVFVKDPYYQTRRDKFLIIGQSLVGKQDYKTFKTYQENLEENVLEHTKFDIFFEISNTHLATRAGQANSTNDFVKVFAGSERGREILEKFGYKDYENIEYVGPIKEEGLDKLMVKVWDKLKNNYNKKIWDDLGKRCIECGQCALVCPTCYCFRIDDEPSLNKGEGARRRCWDTCFYHEFSETAGGHRDLDSTAKRIHFWYYHKFVRVPEKYKVPGCVGCGRCTKVCPVGIDIRKTIELVNHAE